MIKVVINSAVQREQKRDGLFNALSVDSGEGEVAQAVGSNGTCSPMDGRSSYNKGR